MEEKKVLSVTGYYIVLVFLIRVLSEDTGINTDWTAWGNMEWFIFFLSALLPEIFLSRNKESFPHKQNNRPFSGLNQLHKGFCDIDVQVAHESFLILISAHFCPPDSKIKDIKVLLY